MYMRIIDARVHVEHAARLLAAGNGVNNEAIR